MLCAGITNYSPLKRFGVKAGDKVAVVGLGGVGHMTVKLAHALGAHVTVLSHSANKRDDALRLGADDFIATKDESAFECGSLRLHLRHGVRAARLQRLSQPAQARWNHGARRATRPVSACGGARKLAGSLIGGIRETQEMLDFCASMA